MKYKTSKEVFFLSFFDGGTSKTASGTGVAQVKNFYLRRLKVLQIKGLRKVAQVAQVKVQLLFLYICTSTTFNRVCNKFTFYLCHLCQHLKSIENKEL